MLSIHNLKLKSHPGKLRPLYVGPFKVIQAVGHNVFKVDLPVVLQVHSVFNVLLPWQYTGHRMLPALLEVSNNSEYVVDSIIQHQGRSRHYLYLVHRVGYDESEDMWLPESELGNAPDVLR